MIKRYFLNNKKRNFSIASIWIKGGSDMDSITKKGINKMLGSLLTRGCEGFDNFHLSEYIESHGAELNQEVFEDGIFLSIKSLNEHFSKLFPLLDLTINKPILSEIEFEKVKKSTINLIKKDKENPFSICFDKWRKIVYSTHPYAFKIIGNEDTLSKIKYEDILNEYKNFQSREKFMISNNFEINVENFKEEVEKKINKKKSIPRNYDLDNTKRFAYTNNHTSQTIMMIGNQTCSRRSNEYLHLKVLESYLSYGLSSVLFKLFREKNGITYDLGVFNPIRSGNAPFMIYLSVSNKNALFAFELLTSLWKKLLLEPLIDDELYLAKEKLKGSFLLGNQLLDEILQREIQIISYGILPSSEINYISKIEEISSLDIFKLTNKYFSKPLFSISGSKKICLEIKDRWNKNF